MYCSLADFCAWQLHEIGPKVCKQLAADLFVSYEIEGRDTYARIKHAAELNKKRPTKCKISHNLHK